MKTAPPTLTCLNDSWFHGGTETVYTANTCPSVCLCLRLGVTILFHSFHLFSHQTLSFLLQELLSEQLRPTPPPPSSFRISSASQSRSCRSVCCARRGRWCRCCLEGGPSQKALPVCVVGSLCNGVWCHCERIQEDRQPVNRNITCRKSSYQLLYRL